MTITQVRSAGLSAFVAAEVRVAMARANVSQRELARLIPMPQSALSRRVGRNADVDLTVDEVAQIAQALGVDAEGLLVAALCACRDSNPKPSDP